MTKFPLNGSKSQNMANLKKAVRLYLIILFSLLSEHHFRALTMNYTLYAITTQKIANLDTVFQCL